MANDSFLPHTPLSSRIDGFLEHVGRWTSFIWVVLLGVIVVNVLMRYVFSEGRIEMEELQWHLYSVGFLLGLSYAYQADAHIRVDVVHERLGPRMQAWIELYGIFLFLLPFVALVIIYSLPFVASSFALSEISPSPGGLPFRWLIKAFLPLGFVLLLLAVVSRLIRVWTYLFLIEAQKSPEDQDAR
jgi:TRAP-type mannitol/chloroaromatic compound transport system permease small subunit